MAGNIDIALQEKMERYIHGNLTDKEVDELWAELIKDSDYMDYLYMLANLKAIFDDQRKAYLSHSD